MGLPQLENVMLLDQSNGGAAVCISHLNVFTPVLAEAKGSSSDTYWFKAYVGKTATDASVENFPVD